MGSLVKAFAVSAVAALALAMFMVAPGARQEAQAQTPQAGFLIIEKVCTGDDYDPGPGFFDVRVDITFTGSPSDGGINQNSDFDRTIEIGCDEVLMFDDSSTEFSGLFDYVDQYAGGLTSASVLISEINLPALISDSYAGNGCDLGPDTIANFGATFASTGYICQITNDIDLPDISVTKLCPAGGGTSLFQLIAQGPSTDFDNNFACNETTEFEDLLPGAYELTELISGPDEFETLIDCIGFTDESDLDINLTLNLEGDVTCLITNALVAPDDPDENNGIIINNTNNNVVTVANENANNNNNANNNDNNNANNNNNENNNENTQNQTNNQSQVNDNNQQNDIDASPVINISGAGAPAGSSGGGTVIIQPPSTGSAGLMDAGGSGSSAGWLIALAGVMATLSIAAVRTVSKTR